MDVGKQQTQRYLNVADEELRRGLEVSWAVPFGRSQAGNQRDLPAECLQRASKPLTFGCGGGI